MIELQVQEVARANGITTIRGLAERARLAYDTAADLWHARMKRVDLVILNRVCMALDCAPGDLLVFTRDAESADEWQTLYLAAA